MRDLAFEFAYQRPVLTNPRNVRRVLPKKPFERNPARLKVAAKNAQFPVPDLAFPDLRGCPGKSFGQPACVKIIHLALFPLRRGSGPALSLEPVKWRSQCGEKAG